MLRGWGVWERRDHGPCLHKKAHKPTFISGLGEGVFVRAPAPTSEANRIGVGLAPAGGFGGSRLGLVFKLLAEELLLVCRAPLCASPL